MLIVAAAAEEEECCSLERRLFESDVRQRWSRDAWSLTTAGHVTMNTRRPLNPRTLHQSSECQQISLQPSFLTDSNIAPLSSHLLNILNIETYIGRNSAKIELWTRRWSRRWKLCRWWTAATRQSSAAWPPPTPPRGGVPERLPGREDDLACGALKRDAVPLKGDATGRCPVFSVA